ncbi:hypothetical protein Lal_00012163 [Lupinus albus]|uniref:Putative tetratricopeptide-like helical domain-containing protein n=1 Tax=Lupinus albus TaxID=3870 RepID=A0A6A4QJB5_LUPAL|nr:putative tetratricopeptide-like helical domain-containing protein [Lupinus albus]KAF1871946.1 hypothetical protein Lal_00012163 [Lupinus albus]
MVLLPISKKQLCLSLLNSCSSIKQLHQIQSQIHISDLHHDTFLLTQLIYSFSLKPFKNLNHAQKLVRFCNNPSPISWNILIRGYSTTDSPKNAIWVFDEMRKNGIKPNKLTFPFVFKCCAVEKALFEGKQVHGDAVKCGLDTDVYVGNNLVNFYGCCKKILDAKKVFDEMPERSVVSWNSVITASVESLWFKDGIGYFLMMRDYGFVPDETTMVLLLNVCAELGYLSLGRWVHSQIVLRGMVLSVQLGTALVDMYSKSGSVGYGKLVFRRMEKRNVWTWSAMILGLAQHGFADEALELFAMMSHNSKGMVRLPGKDPRGGSDLLLNSVDSRSFIAPACSMENNSNICPNYVTYLGVLCACSHAGMVDEGYRYFRDMECTHGIKPTMIHYGAMVDILGRAGLLSKAYDFVQSMPIEPDPIIWRTLLSACTVCDAHDHTGIGDKVRKKLLLLEPRRGGNLVIVANMYAEVGMWEKAANVRRDMRDGGMKKVAGESCVDLGRSMYRFFAGRDSHPNLFPVYHLLDGLNLHLKMVH